MRVRHGLRTQRRQAPTPPCPHGLKNATTDPVRLGHGSTGTPTQTTASSLIRCPRSTSTRATTATRRGASWSRRTTTSSAGASALAVAANTSCSAPRPIRVCRAASWARASSSRASASTSSASARCTHPASATSGTRARRHALARHRRRECRRGWRGSSLGAGQAEAERTPKEDAAFFDMLLEPALPGEREIECGSSSAICSAHARPHRGVLTCLVISHVRLTYPDLTDFSEKEIIALAEALGGREDKKLANVCGA